MQADCDAEGFIAILTGMSRAGAGPISLLFHRFTGLNHLYPRGFG